MKNAHSVLRNTTLARSPEFLTSLPLHREKGEYLALPKLWGLALAASLGLKPNGTLNLYLKY